MPTCLLTNPISNGNLLAKYLSSRGVECFALIEMDKVSKLPALTEKKKSELDVSLYVGIFCDVSELPAKPDLCFDAVIAGSENGVFLADEMAQQYRVRGNDPANTNWRRYKDTMHEALSRAGLAHIPSREVAQTDDLDGLFHSSADGAWIVKPRASAGAEGVVLCRSRAELESALRAAQWGKMSATWTTNETFVVQPFLLGQEYVVDLVAFEGSYHAAAVCKYVRCSDLGDWGRAFVKKFLFAMPTTTALSQRLIDYARCAAKAVGISNGPVHVELIDTDDGPVMVEIASRMHGTSIPNLFAECYDNSLLEQIYACYFNDGEDMGDARLLNPAILTQVIARSAGEFPGLTAGQAARLHHIEGLFNHDLRLDPQERFAATTDLMSVPMFATFSHESVDVVWKSLRQFEKLVSPLFDNLTPSEAQWADLERNYRDIVQCDGHAMKAPVAVGSWQEAGR